MADGGFPRRGFFYRSIQQIQKKQIDSVSSKQDTRLKSDISPEEFRRAGHDVVDWIADYLTHPEQLNVSPDVRPGELIDKLDPEPPREGTQPSEMLADFDRTILPHVMHWNHPGFMAYFSAGGSNPGILAESLTAALNNIGLLWYSSPALTELEQTTLKWLAQLLGLQQSWFGMINGGASTASLHAIIAAREQANIAAREAGSELDLNRIVIYASEQAHSSIAKTMSILGRDPDACRKIPCNGVFSMQPERLRDSIESDLGNGLFPIAIVATIGTTASASVDPVDDIADIASEFKLWLHVDAAYAGAAAMLDEKAHHFKGVDRADSFVVNPHKWLFVPMDCAAFYTSRPEVLKHALSLVPEYLSSQEHSSAVNFMEYSIPLGRRFRALKLWYVLRTLGSDRIISILREHIRLAGLLADWVDKSADFQRVAPVHFSLVCLHYCPAGASDEEAAEMSERLLEAVNASGEFLLSHARLDGCFVIRVAIGNIRTSEVHIRRLWELMQGLASSQI